EATHRLTRDSNETIVPSFGQNRRALLDPLSVVPEGLVKRRKLTDGAVDHVPTLGPIEWIDIDFVGDAELRGRIGELAPNGLAPDHDDLIVVSDGRCSSKHVFELRALHRRFQRCRTSR